MFDHCICVTFDSSFYLPPLLSLVFPHHHLRSPVFARTQSPAVANHNPRIKTSGCIL
ncbi:unnamed protein product, partial [Vitis vinifera]|uniref:Uncharacterized protein n=1 Tax=Vitis vinifera TaxID=29760 RepID=D7TRX0_VITVI